MKSSEALLRLGLFAGSIAANTPLDEVTDAHPGLELPDDRSAPARFVLAARMGHLMMLLRANADRSWKELREAYPTHEIGCASDAELEDLAYVLDAIADVISKDSPMGWKKLRKIVTVFMG